MNTVNYCYFRKILTNVEIINLKTLSTLIVAAVDMTESRLVAGGEVVGGERGFDDAEVATANAAAAVDVLLLYTRINISKNNKSVRHSTERVSNGSQHLDTTEVKDKDFE